MTLSYLLIAIIPDEILYWYLDRLYGRIYKLKSDREKAFKLLDSLDPSFDHVKGFQIHLLNKINQLDDRRKEVETTIKALESVLSTKNN